MSIITFLKSLFSNNKKEKINNSSDINKEDKNIEENINKEDINPTDNFSFKEKEDENIIYDSDISESSNKNDTVYEEELVEEDQKEIPLISSSEQFTVFDISTIKDILRPIVRAYNYQKKNIYAKNTTSIKVLKCFITSSSNDKLLIFRPTQSDKYNKEISSFVRRYILKDFCNILVKKNINDLLEIECIGGKILIRKKNYKYNNTTDY